MLNILSFIVGLVSLVIVIPATIPFLGWANWLALPLILIGVVLGALSSSNGGRNFCLVVGLIAVVRLSLGGGIILRASPRRAALANKVGKPAS